LNELLRSAQKIGTNAVLNTCFDDALDVNTQFHGAAVLIEPLSSPAAMAVAPSTHGIKSERDPGGTDD
jgi:hypothetical protein